MGGISIWQLLIIAVIVILLFGTKKLRNLGGDLGSAVKGFKNAVTDEKEDKTEVTQASDSITDKQVAQEKTTKEGRKKDNSQA